MRHDLCCSVLVRLIRLVGGVADYEPKLAFVDKKRVDIIVTLAGETYWLDFFCVNPCAPSNAKKFKSALAAVTARAQAKSRKYATRAAAFNATFVPFGMNAFGAFHDRASKFLMILATVLHNLNTDITVSRSFCRMIHEVQIALFRGNHQAFLLNTRANAGINRPLIPPLSEPNTRFSSFGRVLRRNGRNVGS